MFDQSNGGRGIGDPLGGWAFKEDMLQWLFILGANSVNASMMTQDLPVIRFVESDDDLEERHRAMAKLQSQAALPPYP